MSSDSYQKLTDRLEELTSLNGIAGILHWDQEVIMPSGGVEFRAKQMSTLAGILHEKSTDPAIGDWLNDLESRPVNDFDFYQAANIREAKRDYEREVKIPKKLAQEMAELSSTSRQVWVKARQENSFKDFVPCIKRWIELRKKWASHIEPDKSAYDVNIDVYERGGSTEKFEVIFEKVKQELIPLVKAIQENGKNLDSSFLEGDFSTEKQKELGKQISEEIGFAFDKGRMDVSVHPFCGGSHPTDVRITTRYRSDNFVESLYAVIHETGHGLYEQGRMERDRNLPVSEHLSMGIHESQSLFWERMIAQSESFCHCYLPKFKEAFPGKLGDVSVRKFYEGINFSEPSFIRVEADEVTYPLHIILRFEIEKGLFDGSISPDDLPGIWNDKMETYLGIRPKTDSEGALQDIHWSMGSFGYFPSYTLGAMYACQFFNALKKKDPDVEEKIKSGKYVDIKEWLNEKIHQKGRLYSTDDLVTQVTGEPLNPDHFIQYLKDKYSDIYQL
jgi:carboxypeptidase Taq